MKKGFTLVELLAVMIILAIIALITVPIVLNLINDAKERAGSLSAEKYIDAVKQAVLEKNLDEKFKPNECEVNTDGSLNCDGTTLEIDASGKKPDGGKIKFYSREVETAFLIYGDKTMGMQRNGEFALLEEPKSFAEDSWDTIAANVRAGNLSKYKVGDTKEIALTGFTNGEESSNGLYTVRIANTSTPEECSTSGFSQTACGFVIEFEDIITTHNMNPSGEYKGTQYDYGWNVDGYPASSMYTYIQNDIYNALPEELKKYVIDTHVVSGHGLNDSPNKETTDKLYLLSTAEVWQQGTSNRIDHDTARDITRQLDYYKNYENEDGSIGVTTDNYSGAIKKYNGSAYWRWLRSADSYDTTTFYGVSGNGDWGGNDADDTNGVAVAFRIG